MAKRTPDLTKRISEMIPQYPDWTTETLLVSDTGYDRTTVRNFLCFCHQTFMICEENGKLSRIDRFIKEN